jgi:hypothetical protein
MGFIAENAAKGLVSYAGGQVGGYVFDLIFGGGGSEEYKEIKKLGAQLNSVQTSINNLQNELEVFSAEILAELQELEEEQLYLTWSTKNAAVLENLTHVRVQYDRYTDYANSPEETSRTSVNELVTQILDTNVGTEVAMCNLNELILGEGEDKGVLELWQEMMSPLLVQRKRVWQEAIDNFQRYYLTIVTAQAQAINLLVEAFNQRGNHALTKEKWNDYKRLILSQEDLFLKNFDLLILDSESNTRWADSTKWHYKFTYYDGIDLRSPGGIADWYQPRVERESAEKLLYNACSRAENSRRIVIHMIYPQRYSPIPDESTDWFPFPNLENVEIQLVSANDQFGTSIQATTIQLIPIIEEEVIFDSRFIKRFIFDFPNDLPDGDYRMKDINGIDGLKTIECKFSGLINFQRAKVLSFFLTLSVDKTFAFMDFCPYSAPFDEIST